MNSYKPSQKILEKYANVLVNYALGSGQGIKKGETVRVVASEVAKPLYFEIYKAVIKAGGNIMSAFMPDTTKEYNFEKFFYENATDQQISHTSKNFLEAIAKDSDHQIVIIGESMVGALKGVDSSKMMKRGEAFKSFMDLRNKKENAGKFTWTLALYGTEAMAKEAGLSIKEYWDQITKACYLNEKDPVSKWKEFQKQIDGYLKRINKMDIEKVHVKGADADLWIKLTPKSKWIGGTGRNIPSFEIFTSPDWRGTDGWIKFNQPLYFYGNVMKGIELWFEKGVVVKSKATQNEKVIKDMIATKNADKVGEFSMTDSRFSKITKFMANTLYDENVGGKFGNTHIALGKAYKNCYKGDASKVTKKEWEKLGYNESSVHTDIISTTDRTITAYLKGGKTKIIYEKGKYCF